MTNPYRAMCAELLEALEIQLDELRFNNRLCIRARALLDQPEPPVAGEVAAALIELRSTVMALDQLKMYVAAQRVKRAADLLQRQHPQPVAVSERLPGQEDCDEQGRCWMFGNVEGDWRLISAINSGIPKLKYCFSHWLPANALPTPETTNE